MRAELFEVIARYRHGAGEAPEGSAPVVLQVQAFPVGAAALPPTGDG
ncbi:MULTISPECIES: hypothetical protein [unclassified Streptomyces]